MVINSHDILLFTANLQTSIRWIRRNAGRREISKVSFFLDVRFGPDRWTNKAFSQSIRDTCVWLTVVLMPTLLPTLLLWLRPTLASRQMETMRNNTRENSVWLNPQQTIAASKHGRKMWTPLVSASGYSPGRAIIVNTIYIPTIVQFHRILRDRPPTSCWVHLYRRDEDDDAQLTVIWERETWRRWATGRSHKSRGTNARNHSSGAVA